MPLANTVTCQYKSEFLFLSPDFSDTFLIPEEYKLKKKMNLANFGDLRSLNVTGNFNKKIVHLMMHL